MPEYIEREEALRMMKTSKKDKPSWGDWDIAHDCCIDCVNAAPTADVVEVVRCKDCKYLLKDNLLKDKMICTHKDNRVFGTAKTTFANAFCSYGERKE